MGHRNLGKSTGNGEVAECGLEDISTVELIWPFFTLNESWMIKQRIVGFLEQCPDFVRENQFRIG